MKHEAIIFDMDGLLVDSETVWFRAEADVIEARGFKYTQEVREKLIGMRMDEFAVILVDHYQMDEPVERLVDEMNEAMLRLIPQLVKPQPGAPELIDFAQAQGWPVAIASSSPVAIIEAIVESQGWGDAFRVRCSADDVARGKPAPDVYLAAAKALNVPPTKCLALEDSPNGARAAIAAGMTCYGVPDTTHKGQPIFDGITPHVFDSLHDVLHALRNGHSL